MSVPSSTKKRLLDIEAKLPANRRTKFRKAISQRLDRLDGSQSHLVDGAQIGGLLGAILEAIPGAETLTGIDDWVEVGASIGAWVGHTKDRKAREERTRVRALIDEVMHETFA